MRRLQINTEEGLRDEAEGWEDPNTVAGTCIMLPDEGDGPMEGVYFPSKEAGQNNDEHKIPDGTSQEGVETAG